MITQSEAADKITQPEAAKKTFAILTLGCKVNTYESDMISIDMRQAGFIEKAFEECCDIYIVNTCTVTNIADRKSRQMLHRARKKNPEALIVAAGCYVDAVKQGKGLPDDSVDLWVPNRDKMRLAELCLERTEHVEHTEYTEDTEHTEHAVKEIPSLPDKRFDGERFLTRLDGHTRAFVKVEDGCNLFCSYCIIPYVRGRVCSRPVEDTLREVRALSDSGVTEIVLTGIHLSSMGEQLLETIEGIERIPGIRRIRLGSLEPRWITQEVAERLSAITKLCPHFHLSLQSGSDRILKLMNRHYSAAEFKEKTALLRTFFPNAAITTDIIVGFPGETEQDFEETIDFVKQVRFYEAHVFKFSRRKGTAADRMDGQISEKVKSVRSERLIEETLKHSTAFRKQFLGKTLEFLVEETVEIDTQYYLTGYTPEYVRCLKPVGKEESGKLKAGQICRAAAIALKEDSNEGEFLLLE